MRAQLLGAMMWGWVKENVRTLFGAALTVAWFFAAYRFLPRDQMPGKWNEWGDFFAGLFAPVAFLWLVLGYMQQGRELRHQADELRQSVEHQGVLARVANERLVNERREAWRRMLPDIRVLLESIRHDGPDLWVEFKLTNLGANVRKLQFAVSSEKKQGFPLHLSEGESVSVLVFVTNSDHFAIEGEGLTPLGDRVTFEASFTCVLASADHWEATPFIITSQPPFV